MDIVFFFLGVLGALVASMTGTGGGIVFFPVFLAIGISPLQAAATSVVIQSCGMTSGSISWLVYFRQHKREVEILLLLALVSSLFSIAGAYGYIFFVKDVPHDLQITFRVFSFAVAALLAISFYKHRDDADDAVPVKKSDFVWVALISIVGGMLVSAISIGVGEVLAAFLLLRRYRSDLAIAAAVIVTAATVISLVPHFALFTGNVQMRIALFAIPGTIIGGYLARFAAKAISLRKLKLVFIVWVLISSFL